MKLPECQPVSTLNPPPRSDIKQLASQGVVGEVTGEARGQLPPVCRGVGDERGEEAVVRRIPADLHGDLGHLASGRRHTFGDPQTQRFGVAAKRSGNGCESGGDDGPVEDPEAA